MGQLPWMTHNNSLGVCVCFSVRGKCTALYPHMSLFVLSARHTITDMKLSLVRIAFLVKMMVSSNMQTFLSKKHKHTHTYTYIFIWIGCVCLLLVLCFTSLLFSSLYHLTMFAVFYVCVCKNMWLCWIFAILILHVHIIFFYINNFSLHTYLHIAFTYVYVLHMYIHMTYKISL